MAESIEFEGINRQFQTPVENPEEDGPFLNLPPMWGYNNGTLTFTRWQLTPEEIMEIAKTGEVWLAVRTGTRPMQPHWLGSLSFIKERCSDFGGLWRVRSRKAPTTDDLEPA